MRITRICVSWGYDPGEQLNRLHAARWADLEDEEELNRLEEIG